MFWPVGGITYRGLFVNGLDDKFLVIERDVPDFTPRKAYLGSQSVEMTKNIRTRAKQEGHRGLVPYQFLLSGDRLIARSASVMTCHKVSLSALRLHKGTPNTKTNLPFAPIFQICFIICFVWHGPVIEPPLLFNWDSSIQIVKVGKKVNNEIQDSEVTWNNNLSICILTKSRPKGEKISKWDKVVESEFIGQKALTHYTGVGLIINPDKVDSRPVLSNRNIIRATYSSSHLKIGKNKPVKLTVITVHLTHYIKNTIIYKCKAIFQKILMRQFTFCFWY